MNKRIVKLCAIACILVIGCSSSSVKKIQGKWTNIDSQAKIIVTQDTYTLIEVDRTMSLTYIVLEYTEYSVKIKTKSPYNLEIDRIMTPVKIDGKSCLEEFFPSLNVTSTWCK